MVHKQESHPELKPVALLLHASLYVGRDVGKHTHMAGFVSSTLLQRHERFEACPALAFEQSREGFRSLVDRMRSLVPLQQAYILLEHSGHSHRALVQYLQELDIPIYGMPVQKRPAGRLKSDKRDALSLANHLSKQLQRGIQLADKTHLVRRLLPATETALHLKGWMRHRYELIRACTQRKTKLTAICDELFPELSRVLKDPNAVMALSIREQFPTPHAVAPAPLPALAAVRTRSRPSNAQLIELQQLASQSIGTKAVIRQRGLVLEPSQLIRQLKMLQEHVQQRDVEIVKLVEQSRQGQLLTSIPGIGSMQAAAIISAVGNILTFEKAAQLKAYFGWAPASEFSGTSVDRVHLTYGGSRTMKQMFFLSLAKAVQMDCEWARLYQRLVPKKCSYDERKRAYRGRVKVIGRLAGQMIEMVSARLKQDAEVLHQLPPAETPPDPILYDPDVHKRHRKGEDRPLKNTPRQRKGIRLPKRTP